jgi:iron(III) transport system substrate-binding protein
VSSVRTNEYTSGRPLSRRAALRGLGLGGAAVLLGGCGGGGSGSGSASTTPLTAHEQELLDAAQNEGTVTLYTSTEQSIIDNLVQAVADRYDIMLQFQRLNSSQLGQRYTAEAEVGNVVADIALTGDQALGDAFAEKGLLAPISSVPAVAEWPADFTTDFSVILSINPYSMGINTNLVTERPQDWTFLLDPRWNGQIISVDLNNVGLVAFAAWDMLRREYGDDFLRGVGAQRLRLYDSGPSTVQQLAAGAGAIYVPCSLTQAASMTAQDAPVEGVLPANAPITGVESPAFLSANAPNPNAAKLLLTFLVSPDGQKILNQVASSPNNTPGTPALPQRYVRPDFASTAAAKDELIQLLGM